MSQPFIGEIRMISFANAPAGWVLCDGRTFSIWDHEELYNVIGTTYGGDGSSSFKVPDMRGRVPVHKGIDQDNIKYVVGQSGGTETVGLSPNELAAHTHTALVTGADAAQSVPLVNCVPAVAGETVYLALNPAPVPMSALTSGAGQSTGHENMMPYVCINYMISFKGIYPS
jgi:microcystin-dependent protein